MSYIVFVFVVVFVIYYTLFRKSSEINVNIYMYNIQTSLAHIMSNCYSVMIIGIRIIHMTLSHVFSFQKIATL